MAPTYSGWGGELDNSQTITFAENSSPRPKTQPRVLLCELWQRTSAKGTTYMSGFLGKNRVLAFKKDGDAPEHAEAVWQIYLQPNDKETGR